MTRPTAETSMTRIAYVVTTGQKESLQEFAAAQGISVTVLLDLAVQSYFAKHGLTYPRTRRLIEAVA